jgi:drug/metabolite transporter (DMT)-like permease
VALLVFLFLPFWLFDWSPSTWLILGLMLVVIGVVYYANWQTVKCSDCDNEWVPPKPAV